MDVKGDNGDLRWFSMGFHGSKIAIQVELQLLGEFYGLSMFIVDRYDDIVNGIYKTVWAIIEKNCLSPVYT